MSEISPGIEAEVTKPQVPTPIETPKKPGLFSRLFKRGSSSENNSSQPPTETLEDLNERERQTKIFMADTSTSHVEDAKVLEEIRAKKEALEKQKAA